MKVFKTPFQKTGFFSDLITDYLDKAKSLQPYYGNFPDLTGFRKQIDEKNKSFSSTAREVLIAALNEQYADVIVSEQTLGNLESLAAENTFTITTGHQLNLFTGPLYFLYKIISTINLCEELKRNFPAFNFVPIYWMASEDHDFEEIKFFNFKGVKFQWNSQQTGGVGRFNTEGLSEVLSVFEKYIGTSKNAEFLHQLFEKAYVKHTNLAAATRYIANELFGAYGLVVIDGDDVNLKRQFVPYVLKELDDQTSYKQVSSTINALEKSYKIQVNPREINLFYLTESFRERIIVENGVYKVKNKDISWNKEELMAHVRLFPERFSPNVIMRPLYQEVILPNLCYIGGGGELAYWFELQAYFKEVSIPFPILLLRNSVQILSQKQLHKAQKLHISLEELFLKQNDLVKKKIKELSKITVDFTEQKKVLHSQFNTLREVATKTDVSFLGAVNAQEVKQNKGLINLEKRLLKAEKRKHKDVVARIVALQNDVLPNQGLEERQRNFSEYYLEYGPNFIDALKESLHPLDSQFITLVL
ncbi:bacillithiol biosynthesis cysteine-adding enzyme BshC [Tenacibaculum sp. SG-28]|uniref:bacillithiol biosynthesis cysteine-adding enzyme BshC n=1 Tax=Tenacibaculum sp. SG-28 TaxID=754426 RepID=UPI000CF3E582|nr:bacillithiol biosynthesis cysteine-adding enzyme BshC [Tenacibaculum sp. SG-28]PQJ19698.1 bacillithiol biosynthesis cysteine-adding enzyme BshC [Tenacibaculum sp. SG-28]